MFGSGKKGTPDNEPTLKTLAGRDVPVVRDRQVAVTEAQAIDAYRKFLEISPRAPQRAEAMRRIGDLEMDLADNRSATGSDAPDYKAAIGRYNDFLKAYPNDPGNDRVLYQLARAYEQGGDLNTALKTLDRLVKDYPLNRFRDEAQFRRGELLFTAKDYPNAEKAFATVLAGGPGVAYHDRSLYMQGWSQFKQMRLDDALRSFFAVLDLKIAGKQGEGGIETLAGLSRADRELVEDTFRVTSISLANLKGAESIPEFVGDSQARQSYEFRVYEQLGELYIRQDRTKDAADTFSLFARLRPLHAQAPVLQARVIEIYEKTGFANLALEAKKEYVARYGVSSEFRRANPEGWDKAQPLVKTHLAELARHYHASAQKTKASADYQEAVRWYREYLVSFPTDPAAPQSNFLLAELLFEDKRFADASVEYEKTAYGYPAHAKSADAGYAALLAYAQQQKQAPPAEVPALQKASVASALRFASAQPADPRTGPVLADAADKLYALKDNAQASVVAQRLLDLQPPAADKERRVAWTVLGHTAFEAGSFDKAERSYAETLKLVPERDAARNDLVERQAAAIYKQGEQARAAGQTRDAVGHFARVATVAPQSSIRVNAQYDAAASLIALKDWDAATRTLEDFRTRFPNSPLQGEVSGKLAVAYLEKGQWASAAGEFERLATSSPDPKISRDALWQSAELYEKASSRPNATRSYERYLAKYPQPIEPAIEARWRLSKLAAADGNLGREAALMKDIFHADQNGGGARTDRTRYLGATAALAMAEPVAAEYRKIALVEPLQRQLRLKKTKMEEALKAYAVAADYGVADVSTAATFRIATVYRDMGKAMMSSERPKKLSKVELEQYNVLLEEQAFPFEEKATELHEVNARRAATGVYDKWVQSSFDALRELRPVRYGKLERSEGVVDAIR
ncbi:MAG: tetratricopeptide repeat protein [Burkholderiales bacterium]|nr:tetratricopeptide repeat protein [Burkholderiales bacterium]